MSTIWTYSYPGELDHHGIIGQKWGIRRFQNKDGSRTPLGRKRRQETEDLSKYSDDELIRKTNRNRVEANYLNSARDRKNAGRNTKNNKGNSSWVGKLVTSIITTTATTLVADALKNGRNSILYKAGSSIAGSAKNNANVVENAVKKASSIPLDVVKANVHKYGAWYYR